MARFEQIAFDLAKKIADASYEVDQKIYGRSTLSGLYNASPETIRRAIALLVEHDVVRVDRGSGIRVRSQDAAHRYVQHYDVQKMLLQQVDRVYELIEEERRVHRRLEDAFHQLEKLTRRLAFQKGEAHLDAMAGFEPASVPDVPAIAPPIAGDERDGNVEPVVEGDRDDGVGDPTKGV